MHVGCVGFGVRLLLQPTLPNLVFSLLWSDVGYEIAAISVTPSWQLISIIRGRNNSYRIRGSIISLFQSLEISSQFSTSPSTLAVQLA